MEKTKKKIRVGDEVILIAGKNRGERGKVLRLLNKVNKVVVEGLNLAKKHMKPNPQMGQNGGIIEKEMPINISNIALFNPVTQKASRVGYKFLEDGKKVRYFKDNNEVVDTE
jgi:large subunit ribosomal protein L24